MLSIFLTIVTERYAKNRLDIQTLSRKLAWSSGYDDCLTRSRSRVQFSMPTLLFFLDSCITDGAPRANGVRGRSSPDTLWT
jgi:hypothetical protein